MGSTDDLGRSKYVTVYMPLVPFVLSQYSQSPPFVANFPVALPQNVRASSQGRSRLTYLEYKPTFNFCLKIADDLQIFKRLGQRTDPPKSVAELAGPCKADPALLRRILRHLAGKGVVDEAAENDEDSYRATELSEALSSPKGSSGIRHVAKLYAGVFGHLPSYLKSTGYKVPKDNRNGPFQQTVGRPGK